jgi:glycosyltransferase involved in cell wall biosynthesis
MKKFLYIGGEDASQKGAVGTHTNGIINALDSCISISLYCIFYKYAIPAYTPNDVFIFNSKKPQNYLKKIVNIFFYISYIKKNLKYNPVDYIYFRFDPFFYFIFSFFRWEQKIIVEYNDIFIDQINFALNKGEWGRLGSMIRSSFIYKIFIRFNERNAFKNSYFTVTVTEGLSNYCNGIYKSTKYVILNNATNVKISGNIEKINGKLKLSHVGTLTHWDGLEELIDALIIAKKIEKNFDFEFTIIGDGSLSKTLKNKITINNLSKQIKLKSSIPHTEAITHLLNIDVVPLLKTINTYGLSPIKYYEALGLGCYLIVSDIKHINEVPKFAGTIVSFPLDINEIALKLIYIFSNISEIRQKRKDIVNYANENHTWDMRINTLLKFL